MSNSNTSPGTTLTPLRRPSGPILLEPPYLHRQTSEPSDLASTSSNPSSSGRNVPDQRSHTAILALAQDVAAVLYQNPALPANNYSQVPREQMSVQNRHDDEPDYASTSQATHQAPPNYRTATGASTGSPTKARYP